MIKLLTLSNVSPYAEDAVYKICLSLDKYDLCEETNFENYDDLVEKAVKALSEGQHVLIAAENSNYNQLKKTVISRLILEEQSSLTITECISRNADDDVAEIDMASHALVPMGSACHLTMDGLFCGFTCDALEGRLTFMPLDFMRIDTVLEGFLGYLNGEQNREEVPDVPGYDFAKSVGKMVFSLQEIQQRIALVTSESTMWIYNLYNEVPGLTDVASFVEIIDEEKDDEDEEQEATSQSESVKLVGKARDAMYNAHCDIGGAISEIYSVDNDEGEKVYFAYVAVVDRSVAKAKKLSTSNPDDLELLLPHAVTLLCETISQRAKAVTSALTKAEEENDSEEEKKAEPQKKLSKNMIIFACVVLAIALLIPVGVMFRILNEEPTTTIPPYSGSPNVNATADNSTTDPFAASSTTVPTQPNNVPQSSAPDISAAETTAPAISSSKGIFTFYVFGYGHGVGMSQVGANYLAQQGWTAAEILAHYYYDPNTSIISGEKYPEKITYNGTLYDTREYLASALETEMGSSFSYEALKAQAIAIYTFAKYNGYNLSQDAHSYGKTPSELCYRVVDDVMNVGYYIAYGNDVAVTPFHAMSAGKTTSYYNVWGKGIGATVPYLAGGRQSYGDYLHQNFKSVYTITSEDLKKIVKEKLSVDLTGDPANWLTIVTHDQAVREDIGYVSSLNVGGTIITGNEFRIKVMEGAIRSHCFTIVYTPES